MANPPKTQRPASSIASIKSGRMSEKSFLRANDLRPFHRETIMTTGGFKTVKIYSGMDASKKSMNKYQQRPKTAIGIETSTNINKAHKPKNERLLERAKSANQAEKDEIEQRNEGPGHALTSLQEANASLNQRPPTRQIIYNSRHPSCAPPKLYLNDKLRSLAKKQRQRSATHDACDECSSAERYNVIQRRRTKSADVVDRFGSRVHCPKFMRENPFLTHDKLDIGHKQYIWGMAKVYSVDHMKLLRQRHYQSVLNYEYLKRVTTRGVQENARIKLWKEYLEYQRVIDRFGKRNAKKCNNAASASMYNGNHSHAKKHTVVGWTTEANDNEDQDSLSNDFAASLNDDSLIYTDYGTGTDYETPEEEQKYMQREQLSLDKNSGKERPKSSKYKVRKPLPTKMTVDQEIKILDTLSGEVADKVSLQSEDENFI